MNVSLLVDELFTMNEYAPIFVEVHGKKYPFKLEWVGDDKADCKQILLVADMSNPIK